MADPSPETTAEGQEPQPPQGQAPDQGNEPAPEGSQEEPKEPKTYPESYVRQLRREAAQSRNRLAEFEEKVQEYEERDKTEAQRLSERIETAEKRANDAETKLLRFEIAAERGLDAKAASFLTGTTREELELRAEELETLLGESSKGKPATDFSRGARQPVREKGTPEKEHNDLLLRALARQPSS
jgi:hypothetical protein